MKKLALTLLVLVLALFGICEGFLNYALRPDRHAVTTRAWCDSAKSCGALRDTFIVNTKGDSLHAYYLRAEKSRSTAILVHGYNDNALWMGHIASIYDRNLGYNILMPDLYAHGLSSGSWIQMGWNDRKDVLLWCDVAQEMFNAQDIVLHGVSMGAATVMSVSGEKMPKEIKCIIEDCGYTSVWDEFSNQLDEQFGLPPFPLLDLTSELCKVQLGWSFAEASPISQVAKCPLPMLFIHGGNDTYVRTEMVKRLYEAKKGEKELWIAPGSEHARSIDDHPAEYAARVADFCRRYMK